MKADIDFCPACGEPMKDHRVLVVPVIVFDAVLGYFVRKWRHSDPSLN